MSLTRKRITISEKDERILACTQLDADLSIPELAKMSGYTQSVVRSSIARLTEAKAIRKFWYIDVYALGYTLYNVWFTLAAPRAAVWSKLVEFLVNSPAVVFFTETAGRFNYSLTIQTSTLTEYLQFMETLGERFGGCFLEKATATVLSLADLPLVREPRIAGATQAIRIGAMSKRVNCDKLDLSIIAALAENPDASLQAIARSLGEPSTTMSYRFNQLRKNGVIAGCRYFVDYLRLGYSFVYHQLTLAGISAEDNKKLLKYLTNHQSVYYIEQCLGPWDLEIGTVIRRPEELTAFSRDVCDKFGRYISKLESASICGFFKLNGSPYKNDSAH